MNKVKSLLGSFFRFSRNYQYTIQSIIFWIVALFNCGSNDFWFFAIPAIIFSGIQEIIDTLKERTNG